MPMPSPQNNCKGSFLKRLRVLLTVVVAVVFVLLGMSAPAQAGSQTDRSSSDRQHILDFFRQYDVPQQQWAPLIKELNEGRLWDSHTGVTATSIEDRDTPTSTVRISRFSDGSVIVSTVERPTQVVNSDPPAVAGNNAITPMASLAGCTAYTGSGYAVYRGCGVSNQWGNVYVGFNADFSVLNGAYDTIDRVYNQTATCWGIGWSCTAPNFDPVKVREDGWGAATARAHSWVSAQWGSWDVWVQLNVGGNSGWATSS
jgi:hypothetical protein